MKYFKLLLQDPIILQMQKPHLCDKSQQVVVGLQLSDPCAGGQC